MIIKTGEDSYFAAANSEDGFHSYYSECFETPRIGRIYAVKGGPGTGKSRFLRDVADYAAPRGYRCELVYCSSDPSSLDGVILKRSDACIALLDATAPHCFEPRLPGVRDDIVNLGAFWNGERLAAQAEEIEQLNQRKREGYRNTYRYLAGAGKMREIYDCLVRPYIQKEAIASFAERLLSDVGSERFCLETPALMRSIGMRGCVLLDTYFARAKSILLVEDCYSAASYLMRALAEIAREKRLRMRVSYDPIHPSRIDGIFLHGSGIAVAVAEKEECAYPFRCIRMRRFVDCTAMREVRGEIRRVERLRRSMIEGAEQALSEVREAHFGLEEIYSAAMDFEAKEKFTGQFCKRFI